MMKLMKMYGSDKPDIRFGMKFVELNDICKEKIFRYLIVAELIVGINVKGGAFF